MKLTNPQNELLEELKASRQVNVSQSYKPASRLVALGLAYWVPKKFGGSMLVIVEGEKK